MSLTKVKVSDKVLNNLEEEYKTGEYVKEKWGNVNEQYVKRGKRLYFEYSLCIPEGKTREIIMK